MRKLILRLQNLNRLINAGSTGPPPELANKIGISERSVFEYLRLMRSFGAPIKYSRSEHSYHYEHDGGFTIAFKTEAAITSN